MEDPILDERLVRQHELLRIIPIGSTTLWAKISAGEFPRPIKLGNRAVAWRWREVREWIEAQAAASQKAR